MANQTIYPYGPGGSLPSGIGIVDDLYTGGTTNALSAEQGKVLNNRFLETFFENSGSANWQSGNIDNGKIVTNYPNRFLRLEVSSVPQGITSLRIVRGTPPDSTYYMTVHTSTDGTNYTGVTSFGTSSGIINVNITGVVYILFLMWDKPSIERAQSEDITITYESNFVKMSGVSHSPFDSPNTVMGGELSHQMASDLNWLKQLTTSNGDYYWEQGGINSNTGVEETNATAIRTGWIPIRKIDYANLSQNAITGYDFMIMFFDDTKLKVGFIVNRFGDISLKIQSILTTSTGYMRFIYYAKSGGGGAIYPSNQYANELVVSITAKITSDDKVEKIYNNPVLRVDTSDPTIWDGDDGYFYLYGTGKFSTARMYRSANLYEWEETGDAPMNDEEAMKVVTAFGGSALTQFFWAPNVYKVNPTTWLLYIAKPSGGLAILSSNHPTRGYTYVKYIGDGGGGEFIDHNLSYDIDGKLWMFWGGQNSIYRRQMTADGLDWADGSSAELCAGMSTNASGNDNREKTFEGPYLYRRGGYWYLFCSSGLYSTGNYKLRVIRATSLGDTFVDSEGNLATDGYAETVLQSGGSLTGPGHNAPIFVDKNNDTWILYHSYWSGSTSSYSHRHICLDKVEWDANGWPFINDGRPSVSHVIPNM